MTAAAMDAAGPIADQTIAILGAGLIGMTAAAMASQLATANVIVVDPDRGRLELALRFGATHAVVPEQLVTLSSTLTRHGLDCVIEASGANAAFVNAFPLLRIGSCAVLVGAVAPSADVAIGLERIVRRNLRLVGIHNYAPPHLRAAVDFLARTHHEYPFECLVTDWFAIERIEQAFQSARDPRNVRVGVRAAAE